MLLVSQMMSKKLKKGLNLISRYSLSRRAKKTVEDPRKLCNDCKFNHISQDAHPTAMTSCPSAPMGVFETRKKIEEDVMEALRDRNVNKIGLCGMGGIGKTVMAKRIMDRVKEEKLFDEALKVVVSQYVELPKIQQNIANQLGLRLDAEDLATRAYKIYTRLTDKKSTLVVLDDVWERLKLEDLGIPCFDRCNVLFTSRDRHVLEEMETQQIFGIQVLSNSEAWSLFTKTTGNCANREDLRSVAEDVAKECKGLPVALVTVGRALKNKESRELWEDALLQLRSANPTNLPGVIADVYNPLKLSYDYLEDKDARSLFLLCSMFEEDADIHLERLTWYGMGLNMFEGLNLTEARDRTCRLIESLKGPSLLLDGSDENHVKMHDVVRDVAIYTAFEEKPGGFVIDFDRRSWENFPEDCFWISVTNLSNRTDQFPVEFKCPSARLLMMQSGKGRSYNEELTLPDNFFDGMQEIKVLSMEDIHIKSLPPTTQLLRNLKTLLLLECDIESISVVGELLKLEVLCCSRCHNIKALPMEIGRLKRLILLEITNCNNFSRIVPGVISSLVNLEELELRYNGWNAKESRAAESVALAELESLTRLTRLEIEINDVNSVAQEICFPPQIEKYKIKIGRTKAYGLWHDTSFHKGMCLEILGEMNVGNWIRKLHRDTKYLELAQGGANHVNFAELGNVKLTLKILNKIVTPGLKILKLSEFMDNMSSQCCSFSFLNNLVRLEIHLLSGIKNLMSSSVARNLLCLRELQVINCNMMLEVIADDEEQQIDKISLFPALSILHLSDLLELRSFCQWKHDHTLEMPSLESVNVFMCPKMETLTLGSLSTPKLKDVNIVFWRSAEIEDLNEAIQRYFKLKNKLPRREIHMSLDDYLVIVKRFMEAESSLSQKS